jgi:hypothetical protein
VRSDIGTMLNHLRKCGHQSQQVRDWATGEHATKYIRSARASASSTPLLTPQPPSLYSTTSHHPTPALSPLPFSNIPLNPQPTFTPQPMPTPQLIPTPHLMPTSQFMPTPQPMFNYQPGFSPQPSPLQVGNLGPVIAAPTPFSHPLETNTLGVWMQGSPVILSNPPSRPPSSTASHLQGPLASRPQSRLSSNFDQHAFNVHIGKMTVAAGLPLSWTDNPEVRSGFQAFLPWAQLPSRKTLSRTILPALQSSLRTKAQKETKGSSCTLQCDGWTAISMHHLIAFMITVWPKVSLYQYYTFFYNLIILSDLQYSSA